MLLNVRTRQKRAEQGQKLADKAADSSEEHSRELVEMQDRAHDSADRLRESQASQTKKTREVEVSFLMTELGTGLTLAKIALAAADTDTSDRNHQKARAAYDSVLHFINRVPLTQEQSREISAKLASLKERLEQLGESL